MNGWQFVIHQQALETIDRLRFGERREIRAALRKLTENPWSSPDAEVRPPNDRIYSVKRVGRLYVIYWLDEFAREVRVVRVDVPQ